jgi:hypothetical protein
VKEGIIEREAGEVKQDGKKNKFSDHVVGKKIMRTFFGCHVVRKEDSVPVW